MELRTEYLLSGASRQVSKGEGKVAINEDSLVLRSSTGATRSLFYRDLASIETANYRILVRSVDGTALQLSSLGHQYEDAVREIHSARNELVLRDLLMSETVRKQGVMGELSSLRGAEGPCEVRLYDTALVVLPFHYPLVRVRYSDVRDVEATDFALRLTLDSGEIVTLGMLGRERDPLAREITAAMSELDETTQAMVKDACPGVGSEALSGASRLLREGRAASRSDIEALSPDLWKGLEAKLGAMGLATEYGYLASLGRGDMARIGVKRALSREGDEYVWFMIPILGRGGNAVAMEATSGASTGRATYFFRIAPRSVYHSLSEEDARSMAPRCMDSLTEGLRDVNFRRQPIYLRDEQLLLPAFSKHRFSVLAIPGLRDLRARFIGRVAHTTEAEWKAKVSELLAFNASCADDGARWSGGTELDELGD